MENGEIFNGQMLLFLLPIDQKRGSEEERGIGSNNSSCHQCEDKPAYTFRSEDKEAAQHDQR